jgi:hypothetical protein
VGTGAGATCGAAADPAGRGGRVCAASAAVKSSETSI